MFGLVFNVFLPLRQVDKTAREMHLASLKIISNEFFLRLSRPFGLHRE